MCGISGYFQRKTELNKDAIHEMVDLLYHRGPDDQGIEFLKFFRNEVDTAIGFDRLSIRDLSQNGHQPMFSRDRNVILLFNGEIYNADDIREELMELGHEFKSSSDTEVILEGYLEFGLEKTLERLNGMFAIGIFDCKKQEIYLVRDRVGEKPFYYYDNGDLFAFASEYKAFYMHPDFKPKLNEDVLDEYFLFRYIAGNRTLLKNVYAILPGHYLKIKKDAIEEIKYWDIPIADEQKLKEENIEELEKQIKESICSRMVSDVEVGVELSGGIDSSLAAYYAQQEHEQVKTFSVVFEDGRYSEEEYIDHVNRVTGCTPYKFVQSNQKFLEDFIQCVWHCEAPVNHMGSVALQGLCRQVKKEVSVILTGEGADELFGGYVWYQNSMFHEKNGIIEKLRKLKSMINGEIKKQWIGYKQFDETEKYLLSSSQVTPDVIMDIMPNLDFSNCLQERKKIFNEIPGKGIHKYLNYELKTFLIDLLMRQDKISMGSAVECRVPFVDQDLITYVKKNIKGEWLVKPRKIGKSTLQQTKLILKKVCEKLFGTEFTYRNKIGLQMPLKQYLYSDEFQQYMNLDILPGIRKRNYVNYDKFMQWYQAKENLNVVWSIITLEIWMQIFIDNHGKKVKEYKVKRSELGQ